MRSFALLALLILAACDKAPKAAQAPQPRPVRVQAATFTSPVATFTYSGTVQARRQAELSFRVGGKVVARPVDVGAQVKAGQVLAMLDPSDLHNGALAADGATMAAQADFDRTRAEFARYDQLGRGSPAYLPAEYDTRVAAMRMAAARLTQAQRQSDLARDQAAYGTLTADADGIVTALPIELGQVVGAGQTVASVAHTAETEIVADVPEGRIAGVHPGEAVSVALWSAPGAPVAGHVREVGARADAASRTFQVRISVPGMPPAASLGMTASVTFQQPSAAVAVLPVSALVDRAGTPSVWVLDPARGRASLHPVQVAFYREAMVALLSGVAPGEQVVTAGASQIDADLPLVAWAGAAR